MRQIIKICEKIRESGLMKLFLELLERQSDFTMEVKYDPPFAENYDAWTIHISRESVKNG